jgi:hypothetical protein
MLEHNAGRKKINKTRKDRTKARNAGLQRVRTKAHYQRQVRELASLLELGAGEVTAQSIDVGVTRRVAVAFGKKVAEFKNAHGDDAEDDEDDDVSDTINDHNVI